MNQKAQETFVQFKKRSKQSITRARLYMHQTEGGGGKTVFNLDALSLPVLHNEVVEALRSSSAENDRLCSWPRMRNSLNVIGQVELSALLASYPNTGSRLSDVRRINPASVRSHLMAKQDRNLLRSHTLFIPIGSPRCWGSASSWQLKGPEQVGATKGWNIRFFINHRHLLACSY